MARRNKRSAGKSARPSRDFDIIGPTKEQLERHPFALVKVVERGITVGKTYKRQPWYETLGARGSIGKDELQALRFYRDAYDRSEPSHSRSCLDNSLAGGTGDPPIISFVRDKQIVRAIEEAAGHDLLDTLRQLALFDKSTTQLAMERYGTAVGKGGAIVPISSQHPRIIMAEFKRVLRRILPAAEKFYTTI